MHGTKRRDKLADRFYLPLLSRQWRAHHRHCSKTDIVYMNAIFISRNSPFYYRFLCVSVHHYVFAQEN